MDSLQPIPASHPGGGTVRRSAEGRSVSAAPSASDAPVALDEYKAQLLAVRRELLELNKLDEEQRHTHVPSYSELHHQQGQLMRRMSELRGRAQPPAEWVSSAPTTSPIVPAVEPSSQPPATEPEPVAPSPASPTGSETLTLIPADNSVVTAGSVGSPNSTLTTQPPDFGAEAPLRLELPKEMEMQPERVYADEKGIQTESDLDSSRESTGLLTSASDKETQTKRKDFRDLGPFEAPFIMFRYRRHLEPHAEPKDERSAALQELLLFCAFDLNDALVTNRQLLGQLLKEVGAVAAASDKSEFEAAHYALHHLCFGQLQDCLAPFLFDELELLVRRLQRAPQQTPASMPLPPTPPLPQVAGPHEQPDPPSGSELSSPRLSSSGSNSWSSLPDINLQDLCQP